MRKIAILSLAALCLCSCGILSSINPTESELYSWGGWANKQTTNYEDSAYKNFKKQSPESVCKLICTYEDMVTNPGGSRQVPPPGICAEYGYLLLQADTARIFEENATDAQRKVFSGTDYAAIFSQKGAEMFQKEMELYPESALFIKPLIQKFSNK